jgi:hypothetical protein
VKTIRCDINIYKLYIPIFSKDFQYTLYTRNHKVNWTAICFEWPLPVEHVLGTAAIGWWGLNMHKCVKFTWRWVSYWVSPKVAVRSNTESLWPVDQGSAPQDESIEFIHGFFLIYLHSHFMYGKMGWKGTVLWDFASQGLGSLQVYCLWWLDLKAFQNKFPQNDTCVSQAHV